MYMQYKLSSTSEYNCYIYVVHTNSCTMHLNIHSGNVHKHPHMSHVFLTVLGLAVP